MAKLPITIDQDKTHQESIQLVRYLLDHARNKFAREINELSEEWQENSCNFVIKTSGAERSGYIEFQQSRIVIILTIPFIATPFKGKIKSVIEENFKNALS